MRVETCRQGYGGELGLVPHLGDEERDGGGHKDACRMRLEGASSSSRVSGFSVQIPKAINTRAMIQAAS
jgi:hypothetical protein